MPSVESVSSADNAEVEAVIETDFVIYDVAINSNATSAAKQGQEGKIQPFYSTQSKGWIVKESGVEISSGHDVTNQPEHLSRSRNSENDKYLWGYSNTVHSYGPSKWSEHFPICKGFRQSPIAALAKSSKKPGKKLIPLRLWPSNKDGLLFGKLNNNGHSYGMEIKANKGVINIKGGPLGNDVYTINQFHFHYSCDNINTGSEHSINGLKYAGELHVVFYNTKYGDMKTASDKTNGLAVMGFFIKPGYITNLGAYIINLYLNDILNPGNTAHINYGLSLFDLIPMLKNGSENLNYFYYNGSLTTPPCYESVTWLLFQEPIIVARRDVISWRKLRGHEGPLCNNFRPIQPVNYREVFFVNQKDRYG